MITNPKRIQGVTLLEAMLVLMIMASITVLGLRQYNFYRLYADATTVQSNVDTIFSGLSQYYRANCYGSVNTAGYNNSPPSVVVTPGTLNSAKDQTTPFPISITSDLTSVGYIETKLTPTPLVNTASANAYIAQFNPSPPQAAQVCVQTDGGTPPNCTEYKQIGTIVGWTAQVSVLMAEPSKAASYAKLMGATCSSTLAGTYVQPCSANAPGSYVVWERQPSLPSTQTNSTYWASMPLVKQFTKMYQMESPGTAATSNHSPEYQYFYCGN